MMCGLPTLSRMPHAKSRQKQYMINRMKIETLKELSVGGVKGYCV
jgi:hypothetical protein